MCSGTRGCSELVLSSQFSSQSLSSKYLDIECDMLADLKTVAIGRVEPNVRLLAERNAQCHELLDGPVDLAVVVRLGDVRVEKNREPVASIQSEHTTLQGYEQHRVFAGKFKENIQVNIECG